MVLLRRLRDRKSFEAKMRTKSPKTTKAYKMTLDSFESYLSKNSLKLTNDTAEDIVQEYVNWFSLEASNYRGDVGHAPNTVWNYYSRIKKYLRHLKIHIDEIELPSKVEKELYPLKLAEIHDIFRELSSKDITLFLTQIQAGLRLGESVALKKRDFVTGHERLLIKIPAEIAKFGRARTAVVGNEAGQRILKILKNLDDDDLVFGTHENMEFSESNKIQILRHALERIGLNMKYEDTKNTKISSHSFRAYFITKVSRHDPNIAKKLAGEKGYLLQYDRLTDEEYVENYLKFEDDLAIFDLTRRDLKQNKKQQELEERLARLEKQNKELMNYAFKKIEKT